MKLKKTYKQRVRENIAYLVQNAFVYALCDVQISRQSYSMFN